ncbi:MAG: hypothetical protein HZA92_13030 [Verrucomicrobia bacterium]|nr:hypothetical protein [Verrucomicrobiota bacterium]
MWKIFSLCLALLSPAFAAPKITIVVGEKAPAVEKVAATQLAHDLTALFEADVRIQTALPGGAGSTILLGSPATNPAIPADGWPRLSPQGHVLKTTPRGLIVGGGSPAATLWAVSELSYRFGIRHLLHGDVLPIAKPPFKVDGFDVLLDTKTRSRAWDGFNGQPFGLDSWSADDCDALLAQLAKLKFTHIVLPEKIAPFKPLPVDGDSAGRTAFKGAKAFANPDAAAVVAHLKVKAAELGLGVIASGPAADSLVHLGAPSSSVLPQFSLQKLAADLAGHERIVCRATMAGDLDASAHFVSRAAFDSKLTPERALADLVTPICGEGVAERLWMGFGHVEKAARLIAANDPRVGVPDTRLFLRHLESKEPLPAWITEAKTHYTAAMNEMYRGNTRARGGARPFILYHAKRLEFALHYFLALESLYKAHGAPVRADSLEAAVESTYNALNAYADVARDPSDRGVIAVLNEHGYRALRKVADRDGK